MHEGVDGIKNLIPKHHLLYILFISIFSRLKNKKSFFFLHRDFELGPIVNRDLSRRIRTVNGITVDRKVVRNNIKLAAKVITNLDKKWELWQKPQDTPQDADKAQASIDMGIISNNPILNNITDYLIEEASAEEEELLGMM